MSKMSKYKRWAEMGALKEFIELESKLKALSELSDEEWEKVKAEWEKDERTKE